MKQDLAFSKFEVMIMDDMMDLGMDPLNPNHVRLFWQDRLPQEETEDASGNIH